MSEPVLPTADERIAALEGQVAQLQSSLTGLQQQTVNTIAHQIQSLFTNPVLLDSIAHGIALTFANAIVHKAQSSKERAPELKVFEGYVPGAYRAALTDDGSISLEAQVKGSTNAGAGWESVVADFEAKGLLDQFVHLLAAYGAEAGRFYYVMDSISLQEHREKTAQHLAAAVVGAAEDEDKAVADNRSVFVQLLVGESRVERAIYTQFQDVTVIRGEQELIVDGKDIQTNDKITLELDGEAYTGVVAKVELLDPADIAAQPAGYSEKIASGEVKVTGTVTLLTQSVAYGDADAEDLPPIDVNAGTTYEVERNGETLTLAVEALELGDVITVARGGAMIKETVIGVNLPVAAEPALAE